MAGKLAGAEVTVQWSCVRNMEDTQLNCYVARRNKLKVFTTILQVKTEGAV